MIVGCSVYWGIYRTFFIKGPCFCQQPRLYPGGSATKPYVATAAMRLAERGLLDLDRPAHEYIDPWGPSTPRALQLSCTKYFFILFYFIAIQLQLKSSDSSQPSFPGTGDGSAWSLP